MVALWVIIVQTVKMRTPVLLVTFAPAVICPVQPPVVLVPIALRITPLPAPTALLVPTVAPPPLDAPPVPQATIVVAVGHRDVP